MVQNINFYNRVRLILPFGLVVGFFLAACASEGEGASEASPDTSSFSVDTEGMISINGAQILLGVDQISKVEEFLGKAPSIFGMGKFWPKVGLSAVERHGCLQSITVALRPEIKLALDPVGKEVVIEPFKGNVAVAGLEISANKSIRELNAASEIKFSQYGPHTVRYSISDSEGISVYIDYGEYEGRMSNLQFSVSKDKYECRVKSEIKSTPTN